MEIVYILVGLAFGFVIMKLALMFIEWVSKKDDSSR